MEFLLVSEMLGLALVSLLGWWWAMGKVQDLRLELRMAKQMVEALEKEKV
jgi:hypothetical protein